MSRLAKKPIPIPPGVIVTHEGHTWVFRGPKGEVRHTFPSVVIIEQTDEGVKVSLGNRGFARDKWRRAIVGTVAALARNALFGAHNGFSKKLELEGVGYKVLLVGEVASIIRSHKPPEPYKGKGIRYAGEIIRRKAGKKAVSAA